MRVKLNYPVWWPPHILWSCLFTSCLCVAWTKNFRVCIVFFIGSNWNNRNRTRIIFKCFVICLNQIFVQLTVVEACRVVCAGVFPPHLLAYLSQSKIWDLLACFSKLIYAWSNGQKNSLNVIQLRKAPSNMCEEIMPLTVIFLWGVLERFGLFFPPLTWNVPPHKSELWSPKEKQVPHEHPHK